jgi:hypothetical protein
LLLPHDDPPSLSHILFFSAPFFLSGVSGWAAWSLFKDLPRAGLIASIAWVLVCPLAIYLSMSVLKVRDPLNDLAAVVFLMAETLIAVHLVQRRHDTAR